MWSYAVGVALALGAWVSVEFMLVVGAIHVTGGLLWLAGSTDMPAKLWRTSLSLLVAGSMAIWAHGGLAGWRALTTDEVSGLYGLLFLAAALFWGIASWWHGRGGLGDWRWQLAYAAVAAGVLGGVAWLLLGDGPTGPLGDVDSLYDRVRLGNLGELQPLVSLANLRAGQFGQELARALPDLGLLLPALLLVGGLPRLLADPNALVNRAALLGGAALLIFVPLACYQIRWTGYAALLLVPVAAGGTLWLLGALRARLSERGADWASILLVASLALGFNLVPQPARGAAGADVQGTSVRTTAGSSLAPIAAFLADRAEFGDQSLKIMAFVDYGPELIYRTQRHTVCAMPNHRPQPGFIASYRAFTAPAAELAREFVAGLGVDLILVTDHPIETTFYAVADSADSFHAQLLRGEAPAWLSPVGLPGDLAATFRLYRVAAASG